MKWSIKTEFFIAFSIIAIIFVSLLTFLNLAYYDDYYLYKKKNMLVSVYTEIKDAYHGDVEEISDTITGLEDKYGLRVTITDKDGNVIHPSYHSYPAPIEPENQTESEKQQGKKFGPREFQVLPPAEGVGSGKFSYNEEELSEKGYTFSQLQDKRSETKFISILGNLENDNRMTVGLPIAYLEENSAFTSFFLLITSLVTFVVCLVLAYFISKQFSKPIVEINEVATSMATLDFEKKYTGKKTDEIGDLGRNINLLSEYLEEAIGDLKNSNQQLAEEIKEKQRIDDMRKEFIINVSHELKTPIALVQGYAEGLLVNINSSEEDKNYYCDIIIDEAKRMNKLVMQLLDLSKIELGNVQPEMIKLSLKELVERVILKTNLLAQEKKIEILRESLDFTILGDYDMTEQALTNYLTNAIDHTPPKGKIKITGEKISNMIRVSVENEGEPIEESELTNIWEKFYRLDKSRSRQSGGSGIGLSIVRAVIESQKGTYGVFNLENGVVFYFELPEADKK